MENIILFNPSIATSNVGDSIIYSYCEKKLKEIFPYNSFINLPSQMPVSNKILNRFKNVNLRFVCGSNLLQSNMVYKICRYGIATHGIRQWDFPIFNIKKYAPAILLGCGWQNYTAKTNFSTRRIWKRILSKDLMHSVRDEYTKKKLLEIGIANVINTGCPTTWALNEELCSRIPSKKANQVVTTITDYRPNINRDEAMLNTLLQNYSKVHLWLQGIGDYEYFSKFNNSIKNNVEILASRLDTYNSILDNNDIDYVGTRLHGGIHALNRCKRSIIIGIDNRASEMKKDINLPVILEGNIEALENKINSVWNAEIKIPEENIREFIEQFL